MNAVKPIIWSPLSYDEAAVLMREVDEELLSRLDWMTLQPKRILDVGCGTGALSVRLQERYPESQVIAIDHSEAMINEVKKQSKYSNYIFPICSSGENLPILKQSVDLVIAHFLFPWHDNWALLLKEWRRVLKPDGILILTTLGPDTLKEWRENTEIAIRCADMHDIGDLLVQLQFAEPIVDVCYYTMNYRDSKKLFKELQDTGMITCHSVQECPSQKLEVTYEVICAHAFTPQANQYRDEEGAVHVPLSQLVKVKNKN